MEETIKITVREYEKLLEEREKLRKLENAGVEDWEWYHEAMKEYNE